VHEEPERFRTTDNIVFNVVDNKVGQLSQANRAAACISFGKNIGSAKSVHLTNIANLCYGVDVDK